MKKSTVTIGVPAFNEEKNLTHLLATLLTQKTKTIEVEKIFIVSDGSTDRTVEIAKALHDPRIVVVNRKKRLGANATLNEILQMANSDILVLINADVIPLGFDFLEKMIAPIRVGKNVGLTSPDILGATPKNFFEKIIFDSHELKKEMAKSIHDGNNVYMCYGGARALKKSFYTQLRFLDNYPEDSFSYFMCIERSFKFISVENAKILIRLPSTFDDHLRQSSRFDSGKKKLAEIFDKDLVEKEFTFSSMVLLTSLLVNVFKRPFTIIPYLFVNTIIKLKTRNHAYTSKWKVAESSKAVLA